MQWSAINIRLNVICSFWHPWGGVEEPNISVFFSSNFKRCSPSSLIVTLWFYRFIVLLSFSHFSLLLVVLSPVFIPWLVQDTTSSCPLPFTATAPLFWPLWLLRGSDGHCCLRVKTVHSSLSLPLLLVLRDCRRQWQSCTYVLVNLLHSCWVYT